MPISISHAGGTPKEYNVKRWGAVGDGVIDDSAAITTTIQAAYDAGGGVVFFPRGTYLMDSQLVIPNNDAAQPIQPPLTLRGEGGRWDGQFGTATAGASILDLRYDGTVAKMTTFGRGILIIEGLNITDGGTSSLPYLLVTNTTCMIRDNSWWGNSAKNGATCDQDAIVLGGTTAVTGKTADNGFQGYGTVIERNYFSKIRRGIYGRVWCNSVVIQNNTWSYTCGSDNTAAALEIDGTVGFARCNLMSGNLIEMSNYVYGYCFRDASHNHVTGDSFWDAGVGTLASIRLVSALASGSVDNQFLNCYLGALAVIDDTGGNNYFATNGYRIISDLEIYGLITSRPVAVGASTDVRMGYYRSLSDPVNPNEPILTLTRSGQLTLQGTEAAPVGIFTVKNKAGISLELSSTATASQIVSTGHIQLYGAAAATSRVRIARGALQLSSYTTLTRPDISGTAGLLIYDSDLGKCILSNGAAWVNVDGTAL